MILFVSVINLPQHIIISIMIKQIENWKKTCWFNICICTRVSSFERLWSKIFSGTNETAFYVGFCFYFWVFLLVDLLVKFELQFLLVVYFLLILKQPIKTTTYNKKQVRKKALHLIHQFWFTIKNIFFCSKNVDQLTALIWTDMESGNSTGDHWISPVVSNSHFFVTQKSSTFCWPWCSTFDQGVVLL